MKFREFFKKIPKLPLSALLFYLMAILLYNLGFIPSPVQIVELLEILYENYGYIGLFIASFLEGIVYLGLYLPGSFIIALSVFLSDGSFISLFTISIIVTFALTLTSILNYLLGRMLAKRNIKIRKSKGIFASFLHPNILAFYFFNSGLKKYSPWYILIVPILMFCYGLFLAYMLYMFKPFFRGAIESETVMVLLILIWLTIAFIIEVTNKNHLERPIA